MKKVDPKEIKNKANKLSGEFKNFISKGNVVDMAIGVIMGSAFGAIVTAVVNVFMSVCTWGVPGGLSGLVTVLPALNKNQISPLGENMNILTSQQYLDLESTAEQALYIQKGSTYYYKGLAVIDWGTLINAVISFLIIALVLFIIWKVFMYLKKKELEVKEKIHPSKREEEKPSAPVKSEELKVLEQIRDELKKNK